MPPAAGTLRTPDGTRSGRGVGVAQPGLRGLGRRGEPLPAAVRAAFDEELEMHTPLFARQGVTVALSDFPDSAGVLGAAMLPRHEREEESEHAAIPTNSRNS